MLQRGRSNHRGARGGRASDLGGFDVHCCQTHAQCLCMKLLNILESEMRGCGHIIFFMLERGEDFKLLAAPCLVGEARDIWFLLLQCEVHVSVNFSFF